MAVKRPFNHTFDINLSEDRYRRRLNHQGTPFPSSVAEAAYLLVGMKFTDDVYISNFSFKKATDGERTDTFELKHIREFHRRNGPAVSVEIYDALVARELKSFSLDSLLKWARRNKQIRDFLCSETIKAIEKLLETGETEDRALLADEKIVLGELTGSRGRKSISHKVILRKAAANYFLRNPTHRFGDFKKSKGMPSLFRPKSPNGNYLYTDPTMRKWLSDVVPNRRPGRPKNRRN